MTLHRWMMAVALCAGTMMAAPAAVGQERAAQPAEGEFLGGSSSSSGRLLPGMPAFAAVQDFLRRMRDAFPKTQPDAPGFAWPGPPYLDAQSMAFAASRDEMANSSAGDFDRFLAAEAPHRPGDRIVIATCSKPLIAGRASNRAYTRRWEYRWQADRPVPGWQPERMAMRRVASCPAPSATQ